MFITCKFGNEIVEAIQVTTDNTYMVAKWCGGKSGRSTAGKAEKRWVEITTVIGPYRVHPGDYIVKKSNGGVIAVRENVFNEAYEKQEKAA